jgi:hypothetical protein
MGLRLTYNAGLQVLAASGVERQQLWRCSLISGKMDKNCFLPRRKK